jgi:SAM-dependent methyltransferase
MPQKPLKFTDGSAYERFMGIWSRLAGDVFLDWLSPLPDLRWLDVGCGNGAFSEAIVSHCKPRSIRGIDPSPEQIEFALKRHNASISHFETGDAMNLPYENDTFDVASMALVLFFVPQPSQGVAEMRRVVVKGGIVTAYTWDIFGGGFPPHDLHDEMRALGYTPQLPPSADASRMEVMKDLWRDGGLEDIKIHEIVVNRTFNDIDDYWNLNCLSPSVSASLETMKVKDIDKLKQRLVVRLSPNNSGSITISARANAIKGRVP